MPPLLDVCLSSKNFPARRIRHRGKDCWIEEEQDGDPSFQDDSTFQAVGNSDGSYRFEAINKPNHFLWHHDGQLGLHKFETASFDDFCFRVKNAVNGDAMGCSLEAVSRPGHYVRHSAFRVCVSKVERPTEDFCWRWENKLRPSPCSQSGRLAPQPVADGPPCSLSSKDFPTHRIRHRAKEAWLEENDRSSAFDDDSTFHAMVNPDGSYRFEAINKPNHFLRTQADCAMSLQPFESAVVAEFSFRIRPAVSGDATYCSLESSSFPQHFVRHEGFRLRVSKVDGAKGADGFCWRWENKLRPSPLSVTGRLEPQPIAW